MTLRTRNKIYLILFIVSIVFLLAGVGLTIYLSLDGKVHLGEGVISKKGTVSASVIAVLMFLAYIPAASGFVCFGFEKTSADEAIFFLVYLICTFLESMRLIYPDQEILIALVKNFKIVYPATGIPSTSTLIVTISKLVVFVRSMAYLSLLCLPLFPLLKKYLTAEEILGLAAAISVLTSVLCKVRINEFQKNFTHAIANYAQFSWAIAFVFLATFLLIGNFINIRMKKRIPEALGYLGMMVGHLVLSHADSFAMLVVSASVFLIGTTVYLRTMHARLNS